MRNWLILAALTTLGLVAVNGDANASEKLALRVTPNVSSAPGNVIVQATITRDADNRWLHIEADSGAFYRSSAIQLDGDKAPAITEFKLSNLPPGEYAVSALLGDSHGDEVTARRKVIVLSRFGEP